MKRCPAADPGFDIPPMSMPRRIRTACSLAWFTLRTGRQQYAEGFMRGIALGIDSGVNVGVTEMRKVFAPDTAGGA